LFPCSVPTWPPIPGNWTTPLYDPSAYTPSEKPITYGDVYDFFKEYTPTSDEYIEMQERKVETTIYVATCVALLILFIIGAATTGA